MWLSTQRIGKDTRASSYFFTRRAADIVSEACFTVINGDPHDEWAAMDRHYHIRSDTVMISLNFNSYASLVIFFVISVSFCFVFEHWTFIHYMSSVSCVWFLLPCTSLQSNWAWESLKLGMSILFFLWGFSYLLTF